MLSDTLEALIHELDTEIGRLTRLRAEARSALGKDKVPRAVAVAAEPKRRRHRTVAERAEASRKMKAAWDKRKQKQAELVTSETATH